MTHATHPSPASAGEIARSLHVAAPPFSHNPSAWRQRGPIAALAFAGAGIAAYMALYQWGITGGVWDPLFGAGSERVLTSEASQRMHRWMGVPDAALGAVAYLVDGVLCLGGSTRRWQFRPWLVLLFGLFIIPLGLVSAMLIVLQAFVVNEWCTLCLVVAAISFVVAFLAYKEVWATLRFLRRAWHQTRSRAALWNTLWGRYSPEADAVALLDETPPRPQPASAPARGGA